jgi:hypothetical protein
MGAPPRSANEITMTLYAPDANALALARTTLARDPHVTLLDLDGAVIEKPKTDCGNASCDAALAAACSWSALQGAEYYALASVDASYSSTFECTQYDSHLFDKHDECVAGRDTNQHTAAAYTLDIYDVKTCKRVTALSQRITASAGGEEQESRPAALSTLGERVMKTPDLPDQLKVADTGRLEGDVHDGYYALYRDREYSGYVRVKHAGTPREQMRPLYCCIRPRAGDTLVERGRRRFLELAVDATGAYISSVGDTRAGFAAGPGAHLRYYSVDGGLQLGANVEALISANGPVSLSLVTGEIGWGIAVAPGFVITANVGVGRASLHVGGAGENGNTLSDATVHVLPTLRLQTMLATWWYVGLDAGVALTGTFQAPNLGPASLVMPIGRLYLGFDL